MKSPLPIVAGIGASSQWLPPGDWKTILDFLAERHSNVAAETWISRMTKGHVVDETGQRLEPATAYRAGACIFYYRELEQEVSIPFSESIIYEDENLLVADKPHFLPVVPSGRFLHETLLARLRQQGRPDALVPIHRLDRETAGLVLFSLNPKTRGLFTSLFRNREVRKVYEALARPVSGDFEIAAFPRIHRSRIVAGEPFFRMREVPGTPNSETCVDLLEEGNVNTRYRLIPTTGKKHQLRVHLAARGTPIVNDRLYPDEVFVKHFDRGDDFARPLQLLARSLEFRDPLTGQERYFESRRTLAGENRAL